MQLLGGVSQPGGGGPPWQRQRRCDSIRPIRHKSRARPKKSNISARVALQALGSWRPLFASNLGGQPKSGALRLWHRVWPKTQNEMCKVLWTIFLACVCGFMDTLISATRLSPKALLLLCCDWEMQQLHLDPQDNETLWDESAHLPLKPEPKCTIAPDAPRRKLVKEGNATDTHTKSKSNGVKLAGESSFSRENFAKYVAFGLNFTCLLHWIVSSLRVNSFLGQHNGKKTEGKGGHYAPEL